MGSFPIPSFVLRQCHCRRTKRQPCSSVNNSVRDLGWEGGQRTGLHLSITQYRLNYIESSTVRSPLECKPFAGGCMCSFSSSISHCTRARARCRYTRDRDEDALTIVFQEVWNDHLATVVQGFEVNAYLQITILLGSIDVRMCTRAHAGIIDTNVEVVECPNGVFEYSSPVLF